MSGGFVFYLGFSLLDHRFKWARFIHILKAKSQSIRTQQLDTCKAPSPRAAGQLQKQTTDVFMNFGNSE